MLKSLPFFLLHVVCLAVFFVPATLVAVLMCVGLYVVRMFGITAGYHRYFSHRSYKTSRWFQFVMAWIGCSAMQKGPLWWSGHHREHHLYSDTPDDPHSPVVRGFWRSHVGWILSMDEMGTNWTIVRDWLKFPELRWLNTFHWVPGVVLAVVCFLIDGWSGLIWGFFLSTVVLYQGTFLVNSVCHIFGWQRYATPDKSRNNWWVAILTLGEGWHNNHHHYQSSTNQGFFWWEIDISYYVLKFLSIFGVVWGIRTPPKAVLMNEKKPTEIAA